MKEMEGSGATVAGASGAEGFLPVDYSGDRIFVRESGAFERGQALQAEYVAATPFPHTTIENFLPSALLEKCLGDFPRDIQTEKLRAQELYKGLYQPDSLGASFSRSLFYALNGKPFLRFLEGLTGIEGLVADPYFLGGGFHETTRGGKLAIHADFNLHKKLKLRRRINVLIYLNHDWREEFGGALELWSRDMKEKCREIFPVFNRCVVFNTDDDSYHGHPDPLNVPLGQSRKSIALYYYTASDAIFSEEKLRTTKFRVRPNSADASDWALQFKYFIRDLIPPLLTRAFLRWTKGKGHQDL